MVLNGGCRGGRSGSGGGGRGYEKKLMWWRDINNSNSKKPVSENFSKI